MKIPRTAFSVYRTAGEPWHRYALNGVKFECDGANGLAIGTDGTILCVLRWIDESEPQSLLVDKGECRGVTKTGVAAVSPQLLDAIEGKFPRWRECVPAEMPGEVTAAVNAKLLRRALSAIIDHIDSDPHCIVALTVSPKDGDPIILTANNRDNGHCAAAAVMGMYTDSCASRLWEVPAAVEPPVAPKQESAVCWSRLVAGL